jgi:aminoglycoside phosphotransferase (APT) family kinase protein
MTNPLHSDELAIDVGLVRALVGRTRPEWSSLPLSALSTSGSSNALFRLGDELLVRLPRQPNGSVAIEKEARWLPRIGPLLPVSVPDVVAVGEPGLGYPERWSIVRWLEGDVPSVVDPSSEAEPARARLARDLADVVSALQRIPVSPAALADSHLQQYRGEPLRSMDDTTRRDVAACRTIPDLDLDLDAALRVWDDAMALPDPGRGSTVRWFHGDLLAENLLVRRGRLTAVLDFGGLGVGDPTVDLVVAWEVLDRDSRDVFRHVVDVDEQSWLRGRAWALAVALMTFPYYWQTLPHRCASRLAMARAVLEDAGSVRVT